MPVRRVVIPTLMGRDRADIGGTAAYVLALQDRLFMHRVVAQRSERLRDPGTPGQGLDVQEFVQQRIGGAETAESPGGALRVAAHARPSVRIEQNGHAHDTMPGESNARRAAARRMIDAPAPVRELAQQRDGARKARVVRREIENVGIQCSGLSWCVPMTRQDLGNFRCRTGARAPRPANQQDQTDGGGGGAGGPSP